MEVSWILSNEACSAAVPFEGIAAIVEQTVSAASGRCNFASTMLLRDPAGDGDMCEVLPAGAPMEAGSPYILRGRNRPSADSDRSHQGASYIRFSTQERNSG